MSVLNSKIRLCNNIKLTKDYKNVLNYTEQQMLSLCESNTVIANDHYQFIKPNENKISVEAPYKDCLQCNYIAFQNPYYDNKWFFGFIDDVEYSSEKSTIINYTIDVWSTWFNNITLNKCFVIREHVNSDVIGEHTIPENLETGDFVCNNSDNITIGSGDLICCLCSDFPTLMQQYFKKSKYNSIYSGAKAVVFATTQDASYFCQYMEAQQKGDAIISLFMLPNSVLAGDLNFITKQFDLDPTLFGVDHVDITFAPVAESTGETYMGEANVTNISSLNGYVPKNNKLFTGKYNYFYISNNAGIDAEFHYEDFVNNTPVFELIGAFAQGASIKLLPKNYLKYSDVNDSRYFYNYGITAPKYPICSWKSDSYVAWLAENSLNLALENTKNLGSIALGVGVGVAGLATGNLLGLTAGAGMIFNGGTGILNTMKENYLHSRVSDIAKGNTNSGEVQYASGKNCFTIFKMSIRYEFAKSIDSYFDRFGYMVNDLKVPNITGRTYWNYIQISNSDDIGEGNIPNNYMEVINNICHQGVTIWHDHSNIGNYSLNNTIIS